MQKNENNFGFINRITKNGKKSIHFVGLGGIGMSGLAKFLLELGYEVSGSDIKDGPNMLSISELGGTVYIGHCSSNIGEAALLVVSSAIKESNPELIEAKNKKIPIVHRSQVLEALMSGLGLKNPEKQISIGVSGTHGKTSTSGMISMILHHAGVSPSIAVGGQLPELKTNSKIGNGSFFVSELDESDGSIAIYKPNYTIITNLETDHVDHYSGGFEQLINTFETYINRLDKDCKVIINADCPGNKELLSRVNFESVILYSTDPEDPMHNEAQYKAEDIKLNGNESFSKIYKNNEYLGELQLVVPGLHNVSNALAAIATAFENGIEFNVIAKSLKQFSGMKRRFQLIGVANDAKIIDDYAHHPTEIRATLKSAREIVKSGNTKRVVAVFQPHRYSRLAGLWKDFLKCFDEADILYVCDVYSAGESPIGNYTSENFCKEIKHDNCTYISGGLEEIAKNICPEIIAGDIVLTMGAGTITKLGNILIEKMRF